MGGRSQDNREKNTFSNLFSLKFVGLSLHDYLIPRHRQFISWAKNEAEGKKLIDFHLFFFIWIYKLSWSELSWENTEELKKINFALIILIYFLRVFAQRNGMRWEGGEVITFSFFSLACLSFRKFSTLIDFYLRQF